MKWNPSTFVTSITTSRTKMKIAIRVGKKKKKRIKSDLRVGALSETEYQGLSDFS